MSRARRVLLYGESYCGRHRDTTVVTGARASALDVRVDLSTLGDVAPVLAKCGSFSVVRTGDPEICVLENNTMTTIELQALVDSDELRLPAIGEHVWN